MGLFEKIFGYFREKDSRIAARETFKLLNGYTPVFHGWGGEIYESELVRAAIDARARHISKLQIVTAGTAQPTLRNRLRLGPNEWQTWSQFLYRTSTILDCRNNAIICPVMNEAGETTGVYTVLPDKAEVVDYNGTPYMRFRFSAGKVAAIELDKVGILTKYQYKDDLFGEGNAALHPTMELINVQNQGIEEGVKSAASYRFMATLSNWSNEADLKKERERFTRDNLESGGGLLLWPNTYKDVKQIDSKPYTLDAEQMKAIKENVYDYFGVNADVMQNRAIGDAWAAFYEGAIEPISIQLSDVLTRMLFTTRERELGSYVMATANRLQYMSNKDKLDVTAQLMDRGIISINDSREIWNLPPVADGDVRVIRGEYYSVNDKLTVLPNDEEE